MIEQKSTIPETSSVMAVKVVILTMFEFDDGSPGERGLWTARRKLDQVYPFPAGHSDIYSDGEGVVLITTGMGVSNAAASVMALGMDPRFDFSKAYWLVAGISGIDPHQGTMGCAVWTDYVVDGGLAHELDAREIPEDWSTGYMPLMATKPFEREGVYRDPSQVFKLNPKLLQCAYQLTQDTPLLDRPELVGRRAEFVGFPNAQKEPSVMIGSHLADSTFWHGAKMTEFGQKWVEYWTEGQGTFTTKAMEESGTLQSLRNLHNAGKVDYDRVMILRTASNFSMQSPNMSAYQSIAREHGASLSAMNEALEAAFRVGNRVVQALVDNWDDYCGDIPSM